MTPTSAWFPINSERVPNAHLPYLATWACWWMSRSCPSYQYPPKLWSLQDGRSPIAWRGTMRMQCWEPHSGKWIDGQFRGVLSGRFSAQSKACRYWRFIILGGCGSVYEETLLRSAVVKHEYPISAMSAHQWLCFVNQPRSIFIHVSCFSVPAPSGLHGGRPKTILLSGKPWSSVVHRLGFFGHSGPPEILCVMVRSF